jgi:hypothetical protein
MTRAQACVAALCLSLVAPTAHADIRVLVLAYDDTETVAQLLEDTGGFEVAQAPLDADAASQDMLSEQDVVIVWTNHEPDFADELGDVLADYVDGGGAVVELVFGQFAPNHVIRGRWRTQDYACVGTAERDTVFTSGARGRRWLSQHPIIQGVETLQAEGRRTGDAPLLPGAERILDYEDGQILVAAREDKSGRVVWLGFHPDPAALTGQWQLLVVQALAWAANMPSPEDGDGIPADQDNCPMNSNPGQEDLDNDGAGDACDDDIDGDGVDNQTERDLATDPYNKDSDGDGLDDGDEIERGTNPNSRDSDRDGLDDGAEVLVHGTNPTVADTDGDGVNDGDEVDQGLDPLRVDSDDDGVEDGAEIDAGLNPLSPDSDGDGVPDGEEIRLGTDPLDKDTDDGGVDDGTEIARGSNPLDARDDFGKDPDDGGCNTTIGASLGVLKLWIRR